MDLVSQPPGSKGKIDEKIMSKNKGEVKIWLKEPPAGRTHFRRSEVMEYLGLKKSLFSKYLLEFPELRSSKRGKRSWGWYSREKLELWAKVKNMRVNRKMNLEAIRVALDLGSPEQPSPKQPEKTLVNEYVY